MNKRAPHSSGSRPGTTGATREESEMDSTKTVVPQHWAAPQPEWGSWNRAQTMAALAEVIPGDDDFTWNKRAEVLAFVASRLRRCGMEVTDATTAPVGIVDGTLVLRIAALFRLPVPSARRIQEIVLDDIAEQGLHVGIVDPIVYADYRIVGR